ncbi:hypothetical protein O0881_00190 [Janthinobacterium sp. SUN100]|uniref:hypothetical protein n=1 Tax=Janthinobacterium sp. SUN100 TaxID=3004101 RepID=UPI0025B18EE4|nr:hypothetical protein [Janthinobacterium sp. SUN100]MDN2700408.1 hypothetical protein [Janthinobacterium sp. SUN100]
MLAWGIALFCLVVASAGGLHALQYARVAQAAGKDLARLESRRIVSAPVQPSKAQADVQRRWDALAAERAFNWYPVFRALEQTTSADIELLEFVPDKPGRRIVLRGEARTSDALISYLGAMAAQGSFDEVYLAHQKRIQRAGMSLISFEVRAVIAVRASK